jgi:hypothetical protein
MKNVFPFATGSAVTASFAVTASYAETGYALSASLAQTAEVVLFPNPGPTGPVGDPATKNICLITFEEYLDVLAGTHQVNCN